LLILTWWIRDEVVTAVCHHSLLLQCFYCVFSLCNWLQPLGTSAHSI